MRRLAIVLAGLAALFGAPGLAYGGPKELMPGVTYERHVEYVGGRPVVVHVVTTPAPGGAYQLAPVLSNGSVLGRERVTTMQQNVSGQAMSVGINADYFNFQKDYPSGMFMANGVLAQPPNSWRSTLGIGDDGVLRVARIEFYGTWAIGDAKRAALDELNRPLKLGQVGLFTRAWGPTTPTGQYTVDVLVESIDAAMTNVDLSATVVSVRKGGGTPIPPDGAVLQARGSAAAGLAAMAQPGAPFVVKLILKPWWDGVSNAIGGGPALVQQGQTITASGEGFTSSQLTPRDPRTAIGQLSDGRLVLVAVDGRSRASAGMTNGDLAAELHRLGAVTAIALDSGGSTTLAFDGTLLNTPSDGSERLVSDALMVMYFGVYASPPSSSVLSPNGDGVADHERLSWRIVRPSTVDTKIVDSDGQAAWEQSSDVAPGTYTVPDVAFAGLAEGSWHFVVTATDTDGTESTAERNFTINSTLGYLALSSGTVTNGRPPLNVRFRLAHSAHVRVTVERSNGVPVRTLSSMTRDPGSVQVGWNGRNNRGNLVPSGSYRVLVRATNDLGAVSLDAPLLVRRSG